MSEKPMTRLFQPWQQLAICGLGIFVVLQIAILAGQFLGHTLYVHQAKDQVYQRISLDLRYLDVGSLSLNTPINMAAVKRYSDKLNTQLATLDYPVRIRSLQHVESSELPDEIGTYDQSVFAEFHTAEQTVDVEFVVPSLASQLGFSPLALLGALLFAPILSSCRTSPVPLPKEDADAPAQLTPRLVVDLNLKTLGNGIDDRQITLQNKPFCFYIGLLKFCERNPRIPLSHQQEVPAELLNHANKVFARLIELGHTKRKRPDFSANLDKTLSEIRTALDEVFADFPVEKERYYPPRAQGEGSRSKQHSYALTSLQAGDVEISGH